MPKSKRLKAKRKQRRQTGNTKPTRVEVIPAPVQDYPRRNYVPLIITLAIFGAVFAKLFFGAE